MSKKIIIGNWKMNPLSLKEAEKLFIDIVKSVSDIEKAEIVICPPLLYLEKIKSAGSRFKRIFIGAQDTFWGDTGAYTGEVSGEMLYNIGAKYVIVGHSERRAIGESNNDVNKKVKAALGSGLIPILCVGENERNEDHTYLNFVKLQVEECLNGISKNSLSKIIIAYEPIWAIGKGAHPATVAEFHEMNIFIRKILSDKFGVKNVVNVRIIYGGSVDDKNAEDFIKDNKTDGFLLGRASLNPKKFYKITKICEASSK